MDELDVSTVVRVPPERAYEFLMDFPGYARYTDYLEEIRRSGDGGVGTSYEFVLSWWRVTYTARSRVTGVDPPERIDWALEDRLEASGAWVVEPLAADSEAVATLPDDVEVRADGDGPPASRIRLRASFDRGSVGDANLGLPRFVSGGTVLKKVLPVAKREATTILERIVADLEGTEREVDIEVHRRPGFLD